MCALCVRTRAHTLWPLRPSLVPALEADAAGRAAVAHALTRACRMLHRENVCAFHDAQPERADQLAQRSPPPASARPFMSAHGCAIPSPLQPVPPGSPARPACTPGQSGPATAVAVVGRCLWRPSARACPVRVLPAAAGPCPCAVTRRLLARARDRRCAGRPPVERQPLRPRLHGPGRQLL